MERETGRQAEIYAAFKVLCLPSYWVRAMCIKHLGWQARNQVVRRSEEGRKGQTNGICAECTQWVPAKGRTECFPHAFSGDSGDRGRLGKLTLLNIQNYYFLNEINLCGLCNSVDQKLIALVSGFSFSNLNKQCELLHLI